MISLLITHAMRQFLDAAAAATGTGNRPIQSMLSSIQVIDNAFAYQVIVNVCQVE